MADHGLKRVIINADDFGLCAGVNAGIIKAFQEGILSSTSLMTNTPGFEAAVEMAKANPLLGVGLHLNIVRGFPLTERSQIPGLLKEDGYFYGQVYPLFFGIIRGKIKIKEVEKEWRAQIEKGLSTGLKLTHLDSEKHVHVFPPLFRLTLKLAAEYGIYRVRFINERCFAWPPTQMAKAWLVASWCSRARPYIEKLGVKVVDHFFGFCQAGRVSVKWLKKILKKLPLGTSEIMTHPGFLSPDLLELEKNFGSYYINRRRENELKALLAPELRAWLEKWGIRLISYRDL
ncbi:MAG: ChbG/HpnK family deacetylase [Candidatus Aminicenantes bacterium]|nr:ChbG/HpnK family deacetylase [Candidatus Aminicenantes bacterium]